MDFSNQIEALLDATQKYSGIKEAECFASYGASTSHTLKDKKIIESTTTESKGWGLRVLFEGKIGHAYGTDFSTEGIERIIEKAVRNATYQDREAIVGFQDVGEEYTEVLLSDTEWQERSLQDKLDLAGSLQDRILRQFPQVEKIERIGYQEGSGKNYLYNTNGLQLSETSTFGSLYASCIASQDGIKESGGDGQGAIRWQDLDIDMIAQKAGYDATKLLGAQKIKSFSGDVLLTPDMVSVFVGIILPALVIENVDKKVSLFPQAGEMIASPVLSIIDDATLNYRLGSESFDGEGTPTGVTKLVENGKLNTHIYDRYYAKKYNKAATGHAQRGNYRSLPSLGFNNIVISPGEHSEEELISSIKQGVLITDILGAHTANPISGDFSFGISGMYIANGEVQYPFRGATLSGNVKTFLQNIAAIAAETEILGSLEVSMWLVKDMTISG